MTYIEYAHLGVKSDQTIVPIRARINLPIQTGGDWLSIVEIEGTSRSGKYRAFGVDSMQAMQLAMYLLTEMLTGSEEYSDRKMYYGDPEEGWDVVGEDFFASSRRSR